MKEKSSEELLYYFKLLVLVVVLAVVSYGIVKILQLDAVQAQYVGIADTLIFIGFIVKGRSAAKKEKERRADLKANGIQIVADFLEVDLSITRSFIVAEHHLRVVGIDPATGEEKVYETSYFGPNEDPDLKKIPLKIMVYVDPNNSNNYYVEVPFLES